jgi:predicted PurR-regulated permease PerM
MSTTTKASDHPKHLSKAVGEEHRAADESVGKATITEKPGVGPAYQKLTLILLGLVTFFFILWIGQDIIMPLVLATLLAIVVNPLVNLLARYGMNRVLSIVFSLLLAIAVIGGVMYFMSSQIAQFTDSFPAMKGKFEHMYDDAIGWTADLFNMKKSAIREWVANAKANGMKNGSVLVGSTLTTIGGVFAFVFLLPVYMFMILFYKPLLLEFIARLFPRERHAVVGDVLLQTRSLVQSYLVGLLLEAAIVAVLDSVVLLAIGIDYAILFGVIAALLNMIPYIGGLVATALPMAMAVATISPSAALLVLGGFLLVQFIDNNYIVPKVVASRVQVNALVSIVVVLFGGALWGVGGMFLAIPLTAIVKVVCDRVEPLKPFGYLLGDDQPHMASTLLSMSRSIVGKKKK